MKTANTTSLSWFDYFKHFGSLNKDTWYPFSNMAKRDPDTYKEFLRDYHDITGRVSISDDGESFKLSDSFLFLKPVTKT